MDRDKIKAAAEVMLAASNGAAVQRRDLIRTDWLLLDKPERASWNWDLYDYRIKPPPARLWASLTSGGKPAYVHAEKPQQAADPRNRPYRRFVEDLEGDSYD